MTKRDFFILIIKIFGLYTLISTLFSSTVSAFSLILFQSDFYSVSIGLISVIIIGMFFYLLIYKASKIVDLLNLDKHFDDERIDFSSLDSELILKLSVFILGGFLIVENASVLMTEVYQALREDTYGLKRDSGENVYLVLSFVNILIGYLMISNLKAISGYFNRLNSK
ncbi:hypothetical protein [Mangrovivirga cuniculi]|uniref:Uncharacterized protein n=1 Tax=Mangrovivirga cuniculi TaxID=2715131 RepID=A0A4D7JSI0_9BACT|nr:hypothetical protein [Mangrovivirga cuniculi]QCK15642.1 hypothetical protein DCC35_13255 [Mangrovivirga cuniculi]